MFRESSFYEDCFQHNPFLQPPRRLHACHHYKYPYLSLCICLLRVHLCFRLGCVSATTLSCCQLTFNIYHYFAFRCIQISFPTHKLLCFPLLASIYLSIYFFFRRILTLCYPTNVTAESVLPCSES